MERHWTCMLQWQNDDLGLGSHSDSNNVLDLDLESLCDDTTPDQTLRLREVRVYEVCTTGLQVLFLRERQGLCKVQDR
jgi:hypothetical protein